MARVVKTKAKATAPAKMTKQVRVEHVFTTVMNDDDLDTFVAEVVGEFETHLDADAGEEHVISSRAFVDDLNKDEFKRIEKLYRESVGA